ncbi:MAG: hypothetical protein NWF14_05335 [Candidatus Bathyarchaeota archaeon]|nr:hypothetical protein [Candidatus Bathyarchaeota archaeon]
MSGCAKIHNQFDKLANGEIQVGELPSWLPVKGKMAWYIYQGPHSELLAKGHNEFWKKFTIASLKMAGSPGDIYLCSPENHEEDNYTKLLTIIWCPIK